MGIKQKSSKRRQKKRVQTHRRSILSISFVVVMLIVVMSVNAMSLKAKEETYQIQVADLTNQIQEEEARSAEIDELEEYVGTDEYVEEVAKEKLGLVYENELIFRAK